MNSFEMSVIEYLDRIHRMLFTLLSEKEKEKFNDEIKKVLNIKLKAAKAELKENKDE